MIAAAADNADEEDLDLDDELLDIHGAVVWPGCLIA